MKTTYHISLIATIFLISWGLAHSVYASESSPQRFEAGKGTFLLNGRPYVIKAAELHYPRIPRPYWDHRIKMCKALGMNTICLYVFWNVHEQIPGEFDFTGQNDLRHFVELCKENDMNVILRPGPYVCAEWEMGGLPWWLLKKKDIRLRELDPYFIERVDKFQEAVAQQVGDLTISDGGPIIMVQVENEYGSYGTDKPYISTIRDMLRKNFGKDVTLFQCDWSSNFLNNGLDDLIWTINFGTGADIEEQFAPLKKVRPDSPLMCSEFWSGWFDKWGAEHETRPTADMIKGIEDMLSRDISFSLYMTHGGTNWGHWAGANSPGYAPDVTSYDYDAPISESGRPTQKYMELRSAMSRYNNGDPMPELPSPIPTTSISPFKLTEAAPLFDNLPMAKTESGIHTMEEYDQGFGSILYRTALPEIKDSALLTVTEPHDYARIFVDSKFIGALDRRNGETQLTIPAGSSLDILVEAMGRINFGRAIKDFKGITDRVTLSRSVDDQNEPAELKEWEVYNLPDSPNFYSTLHYVPVDSILASSKLKLPAGAYKGTFEVTKPADTFLDLSSWGKGLLYVNGHAIGRFWNIGPQQTLYMPGCWLKEGENEIMIFDIIGPQDLTCQGLETPILDRLSIAEEAINLTKEPEISQSDLILQAELKPGNGWQKVTTDQPARGRYACIEICDTFEDGAASIAEIYLTDNNGERIPRERWKAIYATSEKKTGNHTADKAFDLQESTYWSSDGDTAFPQRIIIDLGDTHTVTGLELLPRVETGAPDSIRHLNLYLIP